MTSSYDVLQGGKTGAAQLASADYVKDAGHKRNSPNQNPGDNAWFVGFAPRSAPEIVVVALFEHGNWGRYAAPIVRDVMKAYFDKQARLQSERRGAPDNLAALGGPARHTARP